jgi:Aspartyl protease
MSVHGLLDTGASISAIDTDIVQNLGLQPTGATLIHTPSTGVTPYQTSTYDIRIVIFGSVTAHSFILPAVAVTESALKDFGFQVLIGRDVLVHCLFVYDGRANIFSLAF